MKRFSIFCAAIGAMLLAACHSGTFDEPDGLQGDTIKLSTDRLTFGADGATKEVTSKGAFWTIINFQENGNTYIAHPEAVESDEYAAYDFEFENLEGAFCDEANPAVTLVRSPWFELRRELRSITVTTTPNDTGKERSVVFTLEDRDYFGRLTVTQAAE